MTTYEAKYAKAAECLAKDRDSLLTFYDFPAEHWIHIRTTNPIESTFATVRLRTAKTRGCVSRASKTDYKRSSENRRLRSSIPNICKKLSLPDHAASTPGSELESNISTSKRSALARRFESSRPDQLINYLRLPPWRPYFICGSFGQFLEYGLTRVFVSHRRCRALYGPST
jgi:hypothetical protein